MFGSIFKEKSGLKNAKSPDGANEFVHPLKQFEFHKKYSIRRAQPASDNLRPCHVSQIFKPVVEATNVIIGHKCNNVHKCNKRSQI